MLKINNIKPLFNKIVTTCNVYEKGKEVNGILIKTEGTIKEYQTVEAVGSMVRDIKVGDIVMINPTRYMIPKHKDKKNSLSNVIEDELSIGIDFPIVEFGSKQHLLLNDQDIYYIVEGEEVDDNIKQNIILPKKKKIIV